MKKQVNSAILASAISAALAVSLGTFGVSSRVAAADAADVSGVTAEDLLKLLVDEGVIDKSKIKALSEKLKARHRAVAGSAVEQTSVQEKDTKPTSEAGVVRVPYVPKYIKDEIRDQVRMGLKEDVSRDVLAQAKQEKWGLPGALPDWVGRISFSGDMRVREESLFYANGNTQGDYLNLSLANSKGSFTGADPNIFLNTTEDQHRLRARLRLGVKAKVNNEVDVGARMVTGNISDPVSTNQTLGNYGQKWQNNFDLGYLRYRNLNRSLQFSGGRFENPFMSTDLVWDSDLAFEGIAGSWHMLRSNNIDADFQSFDPFITVGAFPLQEVERSQRDKWLFGGQTGFQYEFRNQSKGVLALAYYNYKNIAGKQNTSVDNTEFDFTAPGFLQKGNTLFNIRNSADPAAVLFAHAADYRLLNVYADLDIATFSPVHIMLTADYVKNVGYEKDDVTERTGIEIDPKTAGYQLRAAVGWPTISKARDWQASFIYRYVERDAVLAEFTDSDFHQGGTDAKGYILKFDYGIADNTWLTMRWLSSDEIDGNSYPWAAGATSGTGKLGLDTLQLDLNAKF